MMKARPPTKCKPNGVGASKGKDKQKTKLAKGIVAKFVMSTGTAPTRLSNVRATMLKVTLVPM